jgi:hypothetical protein
MEAAERDGSMSAALQLVQPDTAELEAEGSALVLRAQSLEITDDESYTAAVQFMNDCVTRRRVIADKFAKPKRDAHAAHKSICALEAELLLVVDKAEREAKRRLAAYKLEQERRAEEERRRLEAEARRIEEERILAEAQEAQDAGEVDEAEAIISEPIAPPPVRVAPPVPKIAGVSFRESWQFEVTSLMDLVRHVAAHPEDANLLQANTSAIRSLVISRKSLCKIPGVRVWNEQAVASRGPR